MRFIKDLDGDYVSVDKIEAIYVVTDNPFGREYAVFVILKEIRHYLLSADSEEECDKWIEDETRPWSICD